METSLLGHLILLIIVFLFFYWVYLFAIAPTFRMIFRNKFFEKRDEIREFLERTDISKNQIIIAKSLDQSICMMLDSLSEIHIRPLMRYIDAHNLSEEQKKEQNAFRKLIDDDPFLREKFYKTCETMLGVLIVNTLPYMIQNAPVFIIKKIVKFQFLSWKRLLKTMKSMIDTFLLIEKNGNEEKEYFSSYAY